MKNYITLYIIATFFIVSCSKDDSGSNDDSGISNPDEVARIMNENLILPPGSFTVDPATVQTDNSITINSNNTGVIPLSGGQTMTNQIAFNAPNGNVNAVGMRFGNNGPIYFVPVNTNGSTSGIGNFQFSLNSGICEDLSRICHDIRCYEFAQTSSGSISASNIQQVAMMCGNCDEPSCSGLVDPSDCGGLAGLDGSPRFNLAWSNTSVDLDLYVTDPTGETLYYSNQSSSSGGSMDIDCLGSNCTDENIYWANGGPSGTYQFYVNYFSGTSAASFTVTVRDNNSTVTTYNGSLSSGNSETWTYTKS